MLTAWNPVGVCPVVCKDEYDSYAKHVLLMLNETADRHDIYQYLFEIETEYMGLNANTQNLEKTVDDLFQLKKLKLT